MDSSRRDPKPEEADRLWSEKRRHLDDLIRIYEKILTVTVSADLHSLGQCMNEASSITDGLKDVDRELEGIDTSSENPMPADLIPLVERARDLNLRITQAIASQAEGTKAEAKRIKDLRRAISRYRPYREPRNRVDRMG